MKLFLFCALAFVLSGDACSRTAAPDLHRDEQIKNSNPPLKTGDEVMTVGRNDVGTVQAPASAPPTIKFPDGSSVDATLVETVRMPK